MPRFGTLDDLNDWLEQRYRASDVAAKIGSLAFAKRDGLDHAGRAN